MFSNILSKVNVDTELTAKKNHILTAKIKLTEFIFAVKNYFRSQNFFSQSKIFFAVNIYFRSQKFFSQSNFIFAVRY